MLTSFNSNIGALSVIQRATSLPCNMAKPNEVIRGRKSNLWLLEYRGPIRKALAPLAP